MKPKVHTLTSENKYKLVGIVSHLSAHKISWMFNQDLGARFQQADSLTLSDGQNKEYKFSVYKFEDEGDVLYTLYSNKQNQLNLIKSIEKIDYVLRCEGFTSELLFSDYLDKIRKLKNILAAFEIEPGKLKNKEKAIFS